MKTRARSRYVAKRIGWTTAELEYLPDPSGHPVEPYGIWDAIRGCWVDRWGDPDPEGDYWATNAAVAKMRARELRDASRVQLEGEEA